MKFSAGFLGLLMTLAMVQVAAAVEWKNLDDEHYLAGRKCSAGYLLGKVTLVCRDETQVLRMEDIWSSFKTKPFVLLGAYGRKPKNVSYPVYAGAEVVGQPADTPILVLDSTGHVRYRGKDERKATEMVVSLLTDMATPKTEAQWRQFLEFEFANLPGHAYVRYLDFKKKFPAAAKECADKFKEIEKISDIKKLATLVKFAAEAKDHRTFDPKKAKLQSSRLKSKIDEVMSKCAALKEAKNPLVVQEAKNALADLAWAKATL